MKNSLLLAVLIVSLTSAQSTFKKTYGGSGNDFFKAMIMTSDSFLVAAGNSNSCGADDDMLVMKIHPSGETVWAKSFGDIGTDAGVGVAEAANHDLIVIGMTQTPDRDYDIVICRISQDGDCVWKKTYGGFGPENAAGIISSKEKNTFTITGSTRSFGNGGWDCYLMKIDESGNVQWFKTYGTSTTDIAYRLIQDSDKGYVITGSTYLSGAGMHDALVIKTDSVGNIVWKKQYGTAVDEGAYSIDRAVGGGYNVIIGHDVTDPIDEKTTVLKLDNNGNLLWSKTYDSGVSGTGWDEPLDLKVISDGSMIIAGVWGGESQTSGTKSALLKVDSLGDVIWGKTYNSSGTSLINGIALGANGEIFLEGYTNELAANTDCMILRTDNAGNIENAAQIIEPVSIATNLQVNDVFLTSYSYDISGMSSQFEHFGDACFGPPAPFRIISVNDVPNDQGKQVFVTWRTIEKDTAVLFQPRKYNVWRKDNDIWTHIAEVPARNDSLLSVVAPTVFDSTINKGMSFSTFQVTAHGDNQNEIMYTKPAAGYSVDNIKPLPPAQFTMHAEGSDFEIQWNESTDEDFHHYVVWRNTTSDFDPKNFPAYRILSTSRFTDAGILAHPQSFYYKIAAVDYSGNISDYGPAISSKVLSVPSPAERPKVFSLEQNYPNPFNPATTIKYQIPKDGVVTITVYDVLGKTVEEVTDQFQAAGYHSVQWNAKLSGSGLYFYHMRAVSNDGTVFSNTKKMTVLK